MRWWIFHLIYCDNNFLMCLSSTIYLQYSGNRSEVASSIWLCDPMDCNLPGSSVHGIFQARILEWVAISFCRRSSQPRDWAQVSHIVGRLSTIWATREVYNTVLHINSGFPGCTSGKESISQCRRCKSCGFDPWGRWSPGVGYGNSLHYLAWRMPWTEQPGGTWFIGSHRIGYDGNYLEHACQFCISILE